MIHADLFSRLMASSVESETYSFAGFPCWEWTRRIKSCYPRLTKRIDGKLRTLLAHRVMAELVLKRKLDPWHETVEHLCEIPWCIQPMHFALVTRSENTRDARARQLGKARLLFKPMLDPDLYSVDRLIRSLPVLKSELTEECPF